MSIDQALSSGIPIPSEVRNAMDRAEEATNKCLEVIINKEELQEKKND